MKSGYPTEKRKNAHAVILFVLPGASNIIMPAGSAAGYAIIGIAAMILSIVMTMRVVFIVDLYLHREHTIDYHFIFHL
jgi:hypothetical protein